MKKFIIIKAILTMLILPSHAFAHEGIIGETLNATMYILFGDKKSDRPKTKIVREVVHVPVQSVTPKQEVVPQNIVAENVQIVNSTEVTAPVQYSVPVTTPVTYPQTATYVQPSVQYTTPVQYSTPVIYSSPAPVYYGSGYYRTYRPYCGGWYHRHHHHHHRRCR